jgi:hypothetical protein
MATQATLDDIEKARWLIDRGYVGTNDIHLLADQLAEYREYQERLAKLKGETDE